MNTKERREKREEKKYKEGNKTGRPQNKAMKSACNSHSRV